MTLAEIRRDHVAARDDLRQAEDWFNRAKVLAETNAVDRAGGEAALGGNAAARERALANAIWGDANYQKATGELRHCQHKVESLQADLESALDERSAARWAVRALVANAILAGQRAGADADELLALVAS